MTAPLCFLDCETDGVHPGRKVWEVAAIRRNPDGGTDQYVAFVNIDLSTADPFGLRVGRFYERHPFGAHLAGNTPPQPVASQPTDVVANQIARITHGAHVVGCVPGFDTGCLEPLLRAHGLIPGWHYQPQDVESWVAGFLRGQGRPVNLPLDSEAISREIGVEPPGEDSRHTALGDAEWAMRMWDRVMSGVPL